MIAYSTLKKYEIIILIYNIKSCRLDLLWFCVPEDIILLDIRPCIIKFGVQTCLNTNRSWIGQPDQLIQVLKKIISEFLASLVLILLFRPFNWGGHFILFMLFHLQYNHLWSSYKLLNHFPQSTCWEFIRPVGYFLNKMYKVATLSKH